MASFFETISEAIREFEQTGFDSVHRLEYWLGKIRESAAQSLTPESVLEEQLNKTFGSIYRRMIDDGQIVKNHPGISRFTIDRLKPKLRGELDRRMAVSRGLIKLNRDAMMEKVSQRFAGWASSIPDGGSRAVDVKETKDHIRKALTSLPFTERRVMIDQGTKFVSSLNEIIATDGGAIAVKWNIRKSPGYNNRPDHKEREGKIYLLRNSWAKEKGLVKPGPAGYYDDITKFGEEIFCSCWGSFLYALRDLPQDMLTRKGELALEEARAKIKAMR